MIKASKQLIHDSLGQLHVRIECISDVDLDIILLSQESHCLIVYVFITFSLTFNHSGKGGCHDDDIARRRKLYCWDLPRGYGDLLSQVIVKNKRNNPRNIVRMSAALLSLEIFLHRWAEK